MGLAAAVLACLAAGAARAASVLMYHNDNTGSGVNPEETLLTPANVTGTNFAKRYATPVDGNVYAQPLYLPGVEVTGGPHAGTHNLVFIATEHDSLYAIDADNGKIVWRTSFTVTGLPGATSIAPMPAADTFTSDTAPEIGITSTPVIDPATNMLYVTAKTKQIVAGNASVPHYVYTLYKIDITDGNATPNANIVASTLIGDTQYNPDTTAYTYRTASSANAAQDIFVPGTGDGAITVNGQSRVYFNAVRQLQRTGLLLYDGKVFLGFGSHGDNGPFHGWFLAYDAGTLAVAAVLTTTPNGGLGGLWASGAAPVVDANGFLYITTGNGTFDGYNNNGVAAGLDSLGFPVNGNFGDSVIKVALDPATTISNPNRNGWGLRIVDYFAPFNNQALDSADTDLGSGGITLLPDSAGNAAHPHLLVEAGKQGNVYLLDRDALGKYTATTDNVVQSQTIIGPSFGAAAFFNGIIYYLGGPDNLKAFTMADATMSTAPVSSTDYFSWPGGTPQISANGSANGIVWCVDRGSAQLRAYAAGNIAHRLWSTAGRSAHRRAWRGQQVHACHHRRRQGLRRHRQRARYLRPTVRSDQAPGRAHRAHGHARFQPPDRAQLDRQRRQRKWLRGGGIDRRRHLHRDRPAQRQRHQLLGEQRPHRRRHLLLPRARLQQFRGAPAFPPTRTSPARPRRAPAPPSTSPPASATPRAR
ncbi:MAG: hypothetical protein WDO13_13805 [Verrucomicrobiota bacterium]